MSRDSIISCILRPLRACEVLPFIFDATLWESFPMSSYPDVFIVGAARTPIGKFLGGLGTLKASELGAVAIREYEEAAMVVSLFALAQWLEAQSLDRARKAIGKLIDLAPPQVLVRDHDGERVIAIEQVDLGALMIVKPGERFALDGIVRTGRSGSTAGSHYQFDGREPRPAKQRAPTRPPRG